VKIVFMGTPWFAVQTLDNLIRNGYEVTAVYTQPDRAAGRGRITVSSPVKIYAARSGLAVEQPDNFKEDRVVERLAGYQPDLVLVFSYGQILPRTVLDMPPLGCVNIHPSLLPRHRGASPVVSALLAGDTFTGVTMMRPVEKLDAGDILMQAQVPVTDYDTAGLLTGKLAGISARLVLEVLPRLEKGEITPRAQDPSRATYLGQLTKEDGEIDWNMPAVDIWRRVRAYNPWPGCYTRWRGKQLKIMMAGLLADPEDAGPGQVRVLQDGKVLGIGTGDGILAVTEVQLEGKRLMPAGDFIRGQRELAGEVLPS
jgi:methionyl-tRNA formyltransferase